MKRFKITLALVAVFSGVFIVFSQNINNSINISSGTLVYDDVNPKVQFQTTINEKRTPVVYLHSQNIYLLFSPKNIQIDKQSDGSLLIQKDGNEINVPPYSTKNYENTDIAIYDADTKNYIYRKNMTVLSEKTAITEKSVPVGHLAIFTGKNIKLINKKKNIDSIILIQSNGIIKFF